MNKQAIQKYIAINNQHIVNVLNKLGETALEGYHGDLEVVYRDGKVVSIKKRESLETRGEL
jgi:hypothetical protein